MLSARERQLDDEMKQSGRANDVIKQQSRDIDQLLADLEKYKAEADRLKWLLANNGRLRYGKTRSNSGKLADARCKWRFLRNG